MMDMAKAQPSVVACLGRSSTAGSGQAFHRIHELERKEQNKRLVFGILEWEQTSRSTAIAPPSFLTSCTGLLRLPGRLDRRLKDGLRPRRHKG
jgi:hypothetical protein